MPSHSWQEWNLTRAKALNDIESAHRSIGGSGPGRRFATEQINHAYAVLLASQFQGFCRDLHSECVDSLVRSIAFPVLEKIWRFEFLWNRSLDRGNANPGAIGSDFNRLGVEFWKEVLAENTLNHGRKQLLEELNAWRNAIAHQDFDPAELGGTTTLHLSEVRDWRRACNHLALSFDSVMMKYLTSITGNPPW
jgi:HEPN superfamily RiboL-PSP-like protein